MWPFRRHASAPAPNTELLSIAARITALEDRMNGWVTEAAKIVDTLTALENRQRMRDVRAAARSGDTVAQDSLAEFKRRRMP